MWQSKNNWQENFVGYEWVYLLGQPELSCFTGARVCLFLPPNLGRSNLGFWQFCSSAFVTGIFSRTKHHQDESSADSPLSCVCSWVFIRSKAYLLGVALLVCGLHNTIFLLHCFVGSPSWQPKKDLECEGEIRKRLKLCGQTCGEGVGVDQRNDVHSHHGGFQSHWLYFTCCFL